MPSSQLSLAIGQALLGGGEAAGLAHARRPQVQPEQAAGERGERGAGDGGRHERGQQRRADRRSPTSTAARRTAAAGGSSGTGRCRRRSRACPRRPAASAPRLPRPLLRMNAPAEIRGAISDRVMGRPMGYLARSSVPDVAHRAQRRSRPTLAASVPAPGGSPLERGGPAARAACHYGGVAHTSASAGVLLRHVRTGRARSRADLVALTGASRNTVSARVDQLIAANLLEEGGRGWSTGGRPPTLLQFNSRAGCVLAVDLGVTSVDVAVTDLSAQILATVGHPIDIADGPGAGARRGRPAGAAGARRGRARPRPTCAPWGSACPGPVEFSTGRPSHPPIMPGWHDYPIPSAFGRYECPVYVDNDVNVMALGEIGDRRLGPGRAGRQGGHRHRLRRHRRRAGSTAGRRAAPATSGTSTSPSPTGGRCICRCGNENCLEAIAGGGALLRDAARGRAAGEPRPARSSSSPPRATAPALELVRERGPHDRHGARRAGQLLQPAPHRHDRRGRAGRRPAAGRHPRGGLRPVACRWPPGRWRSPSATRPDLSGRVGAALMAIEEFLDEDSAVAPGASPADRGGVRAATALHALHAGAARARCALGRLRSR